MDIRPDRSVDASRLNQIAESTHGTGGKSFTAGGQPDVSTENNFSGSASLESIAKEFRKADLKNPSRVNEMINDAVNQLIDSEYPDLATADRRVIGDWMRNDPIVRERILTCFERILS